MFIKYGCIRDEKFYDKVKEVMIYKDLDGNYTGEQTDEYGTITKARMNISGIRKRFTMLCVT